MRTLRREVMILGAFFPIVAVGLATLTLVATILAANLQLVGALGVMMPALVWSGQLWRLLTWTFLEMSPLGLIFACFAFLFFGRDLVHQWGPVRFLQVCAGIVAGSALATCVIALAWPRLMGVPYASAWPLAEALIIAYAMVFPSRTILFSLIIPVAGRQLLVLTVAATLLFALLNSFAPVVPHFAAQALMYAYIRGYSPRLIWLRLRARTYRWSPQRRASHLRRVDREDEPPRWLH
jgi:membrane associated rhomboid family serine protease